jgi:CO/xanthine dehydrogenase FAD-binding subunit
MKPASFKYIQADCEAALLAALSAHGGEAHLLAGGQSLVPMMNFRIVSPSVLIDLNRIDALSFVRSDGNTLRIGALTRHAMLEDSDDVAKGCPLLHDAIKHVGHRAVRNRGTMGGSLALAYPGAEIPLVFITLSAEICLGSARGERRVPAAEFVLGALDTSLAEDEYIKSADICLPPASSKASFVEASRRHGDFAIAASAVVVDRGSDGRISYVRAAVSGGIGTPVRLDLVECGLADKMPRDAVLADLTREAIAGIEVFGDHHYPEDYRRHLLQAVLQRALTEAISKTEAGCVQ